MDKTTTWLVRITCLVFLFGVIAGPKIKNHQRSRKFCDRVSIELGLDLGKEEVKSIQKDCREDPETWGFEPDS